MLGSTDAPSVARAPSLPLHSFELDNTSSLTTATIALPVTHEAEDSIDSAAATSRSEESPPSGSPVAPSMSAAVVCR